MSPNPLRFLEHLRAQGYHPRSDKHSNQLSLCVVHDLVASCRAIARRATAWELVFALNFTLLTGTAEWNVDLVMGQPPIGKPDIVADADIRRARPSTVQIALEIKTVMTEHRKAIKNRKRDFEAHHDHVHRYNERAIAAALLVVNIAGTFRSPLRPAVTRHAQPERLVQHCIDQMRSVTVRSGTTGAGLDAKGLIVVDLDNEDLARARYRVTKPAPPVGDPLHYDAFIQAICQAYETRFGCAVQ
jgi:hypothetical protein